MASIVLTDCALLLDQYDLSGDHNAMSIQVDRAAVENTTFGSSSRTYLPGLMDASFSHNGYSQSDGTSAVEDVLSFDDFASQSIRTMTVVPAGLTAGNVAYTFRSVQADLSLGGSIGDVYAFSVSGNSTSDVGRVTIAEAGASARSSTFDTSGYQLGALSTGDKLIVVVHVLAVTSSPTLDIDIETDDNSGFTTPSDYGSVAQLTAVGSSFNTYTTAETDDYWRLECTIGGTGSITFVAGIGIQAG